nr:hypothetical protein [uncultured Azospirillum sp.]
MHASMQNAAALIAARYGVAGVDVTAGGSGDATEVNCAWVDRLGFASLKAVVTYTATLAAAATLTFAGNLQDASDSGGTGADDYGPALPATVVATGPGGGGTVTGVAELDFDLSGTNRYVRLQVTPNLSAANTDVCEFGVTYILAGATENPVSGTLV